MNNTVESRSFSYGVFSFVTDEIRGTSIPVGIALWSSKPEWLRIRMAGEGERVKGLKASAHPFLHLAETKLDSWIREKQLPYSTPTISPHTDEWWRHATRLFVHSVRLSEPRPIDCKDPEEELELLYEAVVSPQRGAKEKKERIDGVLTRSLGALSERLVRGTVQGFGGRPVPVRRYTCDEKHLVIVEGLNLAAADAEDDADALVSRLQRIREANGSGHKRSVIAFVGYLASPTGLNGEAALVQWIEKKAEAKTFDLLNQQDAFVRRVQRQVNSLEPAQQKRAFFR